MVNVLSMAYLFVVTLLVEAFSRQQSLKKSFVFLQLKNKWNSASLCNYTDTSLKLEIWFR